MRAKIGHLGRGYIIGGFRGEENRDFAPFYPFCGGELRVFPPRQKWALKTTNARKGITTQWITYLLEAIDKGNESVELYQWLIFDIASRLYYSWW